MSFLESPNRSHVVSLAPGKGGLPCDPVVAVHCKYLLRVQVMNGVLEIGSATTERTTGGNTALSRGRA